MKKKALLVLGASTDHLFMIRTALGMSLETVAVDGNPQAPGLTLATYGSPIDFSQVEKVIAYVKSLHAKSVDIGGVLTMGSDVPHLLARIADYFGWIGPSAQTGYLSTHKYAMKVCFRKHGVPVPDFSLVSTIDDIKGCWEKWQCEKVIIKPTDRAGSRGVRMILDHSCIAAALEYARNFSHNNQLILEEFVDGAQISTESLLYDGICVTPGFSDRLYETMGAFHPNIMENGGWVPSQAATTTRKDVQQLVEKAAHALGITKGVAKGDVVICPRRGPMMIEMAARLSGGDFSESLVPLGTGVNYVKTAIEIAMGNLPNFNKLKPERNLAVANRYFFPPPGKLEEIIGVEKCSSLKQLVKLELFFQPGQSIPVMTNHSQRAGVFIVVDESRLKAQAVIDEIYETIKFKIKGKFYSGHPIFYNYKQ
jgi:biotin carboxylase